MTEPLRQRSRKHKVGPRPVTCPAADHDAIGSSMPHIVAANFDQAFGAVFAVGFHLRCLPLRG